MSRLTEAHTPATGMSSKAEKCKLLPSAACAATALKNAATSVWLSAWPLRVAVSDDEKYGSKEASVVPRGTERRAMRATRRTVEARQVPVAE